MNSGKSVELRTAGFCLLAAVVMGVLSPETYAQQSPASASQMSAERIVKTITMDRMKAIMESEGYSVSMHESGCLMWELIGSHVWIAIAEDGESLKFFAGSKGGTATFRKVNEWNRTKRYSRTYLDDEGHAWLEVDLDLTGGVTEARIADFLKACRISFIMWCKEVVI